MPETEVPKDGLHLWSMFWQLSSHRVERNRISPTVISDWLKLNGKQIATLEFTVIEAMDREFLKTLSEEIELNEKRRKEDERRKKAQRA